MTVCLFMRDGQNAKGFESVQDFFADDLRYYLVDRYHRFAWWPKTVVGRVEIDNNPVVMPVKGL